MYYAVFKNSIDPDQLIRNRTMFHSACKYRFLTLESCILMGGALYSKKYPASLDMIFFQKTNNKGADQSAQMCRLICTFVDHKLRRRFSSDEAHIFWILNVKYCTICEATMEDYESKRPQTHFFSC